MKLLFTVCVMLAAYTVDVAGHGFVVDPKSRQFQNYEKTGQMNGDVAEPMSGYGGRVKQTSGNFRLTWPASAAYGMCGDNFPNLRWMKPRAIQKRWKKGQVVTIKSIVWQWHEGRIDLWICKRGTSRINGRTCKQLMRADGKSPYWYPPGYKPGFRDFKSAVPGRSPNDFTWARFPKSRTPFNNFEGTPVYSVKYRLPRWTCRNCVLVWHYLTGNSCIPPCDKGAIRVDPERCSKKMPTCGTRGSKYPEEFWSCSDVDVQ